MSGPSIEINTTTLGFAATALASLALATWRTARASKVWDKVALLEVLLLGDQEKGIPGLVARMKEAERRLDERAQIDMLVNTLAGIVGSTKPGEETGLVRRVYRMWRALGFSQDGPPPAIANMIVQRTREEADRTRREILAGQERRFDRGDEERPDPFEQTDPFLVPTRPAEVHPRESADARELHGRRGTGGGRRRALGPPLPREEPESDQDGDDAPQRPSEPGRRR